MLLMAELIYDWSVMSKSISAARPEWTKAQSNVLELTILMRR